MEEAEGRIGQKNNTLESEFRAEKSLVELCEAESSLNTFVNVSFLILRA